MALIQRANVILEVNDDFVDKYLAQGYNQIDDKGKVIKNGLPTNLNDYKLTYNSLQKKVKQLEAENKKLQELVDKLKSTKKSTSDTTKNKSKTN